MENAKLFVGSLPWAVRDEDLEAHFAAAGTVESALVIMDKFSGRSKGFGFVQMATPEEAQKAIEMFHEQDMQGRNIIVNIAKPREERPRRDDNFSRY